MRIFNLCHRLRPGQPPGVTRARGENPRRPPGVASPGRGDPSSPPMASPFSYDQGRLSASGVALADLAERFGTPLYVYDLSAVAARIAAVREAFAAHPTRLCYSVKANANLRLLQWLAGQGLGFDVVSGGELA